MAQKVYNSAFFLNFLCILWGFWSLFCATLGYTFQQTRVYYPIFEQKNRKNTYFFFLFEIIVCSIDVWGTFFLSSAEIPKKLAVVSVFLSSAEFKHNFFASMSSFSPYYTAVLWKMNASLRVFPKFQIIDVLICMFCVIFSKTDVLICLFLCNFE